MKTLRGDAGTDLVMANWHSSPAVTAGRYAGSSMIVRLDAANGVAG